jgi:hypothetical protein
VDDLVVFLDGPSHMRLEGGMVHVEDTSGKTTFRRVMSIHSLIANHVSAERIIAQWMAASQDDTSLLAEEARAKWQFMALAKDDNVIPFPNQ